MGPTNVALVKLFQADQHLRAACERLDAAAKNVRVQERRVNDTAARLKAAQTHSKELQARSGALDLDLRSRDAHIDKLRTQQQSAKNNKEYQAFLIEINTGKVDKAKVEDEAMRSMEQVEKAGAEVTALATQLETEKTRLTELSAQIGQTLESLQAEVDALVPARQAAAAALPPKVLAEFDRLADRFDGEPMSALAKPDRRREEYLCVACNMDLVTDVYNKLHSRDELVSCPSCRRLLFIPEDLPPEAAVHNKAKPSPKSAPSRRGWTEEDFLSRVEQLNDPVLLETHKQLLLWLRQADGFEVRFNAKGDKLASYNVFADNVKPELLRVFGSGDILVGWGALTRSGFAQLAQEFRERVGRFVKEPQNEHSSHLGEDSRLPALDIDGFVAALEHAARGIARALAASKAAPKAQRRARGRLGQALSKAQGESVSRAAAADHKPSEFEVYVDGALAGIYKGNSAENLERAIKYFLGEAGLPGEVRVASPSSSTSAASGSAVPAAPAPDLASVASVATPDESAPDESLPDESESSSAPADAPTSA